MRMTRPGSWNGYYKAKVQEDFDSHKDLSYNKAKDHDIDPTDNNFVQNNLKETVDSTIYNNKNAYNLAKAENEAIERANQEQVDKAEYKRGFSKKLGIGGQQILLP